ncbi:MAG TPA: glycerophosphodiester phosphodiesterase family protein [Planococcus sp. (in: firmicutes)]|nr:glycerophosphodiester phosphodiesterase family protein [Planococcus sp. (in: firmicutes)]
MDNPAIYSHRGASAYALENTWNAFRKACALDVGIELDVQITNDGVILVFHDDNLKRLSGRNLKIVEVDYDKIKDTKIGKRGRRKLSSDRIPLAYEVFHWAKKKAVPLNIEIKESFAVHPDGAEILASMLEGMDDILLSSFNSELLKKMKRLKPGIETALVVKKNFAVQQMGDMHWVDSVHLHKRLYSENLLTSLKSLEKKVRIYGIAGTEGILNHLSPIVSGIITDHPDRIIEKMRQP